MKESRCIIIISILIMTLLIPILYILRSLKISEELCINIITNLSCGLIVALVTAICQYFITKRKIINNIYSLYFDLYTTYYYVKNNKNFNHYNSYAIFKKIVELSPKINNELEEYHGVFMKKDTTYIKLDPKIKLGEYLKLKNIKELNIKWFNKKTFNKNIEPFICEIENCLKNINENKFNTDKKCMIEMFNYICS